MGYFLVGYQLKHHSELARRRFCDEIERLGGVEALDNTYLIELDGTSQEVHDHFRRFLAAADSAIVVEFVTPPIVTVPLTGTIPWLDERFSATASINELDPVTDRHPP